MNNTTSWRKFFVLGKRFVRRCRSSHLFNEIYIATGAHTATSRNNWKVIGLASLTVSTTGAYLYNNFVNKKTYRKQFDERERVKNEQFLNNVLIGINISVFCAWRIAMFSRHRQALTYMMRNFTIHPACTAPAVLLHSFSHVGPFHLAFNCIAGRSFIHVISHLIAPSEIVAMFFCAASSGACIQLVANNYFAKTKNCSHLPTLGSSGGIYGLISFTCISLPSLPLYLIVFPWYNFKAWQFLVGMTMLDTIGLLKGSSNSGLAHGCHVGGFIVGIFLGLVIFIPTLGLTKIHPITSVDFFQAYTKSVFDFFYLSDLFDRFKYFVVVLHDITIMGTKKFD